MNIGMTTIVGPIWNNQVSPLNGIISSFNKTLVPSAQVGIIPKGPSYSSPIHYCIPVDISLSNHTNTNTPIVTPNIKIIVDRIIHIN
jgi:hypothetical protein